MVSGLAGSQALRAELGFHSAVSHSVPFGPSALQLNVIGQFHRRRLHLDEIGLRTVRQWSHVVENTTSTFQMAITFLYLSACDVASIAYSSSRLHATLTSILEFLDPENVMKCRTGFNIAYF